MTQFDLTPLLRTAIGFDRLSRLAASQDASASYPPYNIERTGDDAYRLTMAVAGFAPADIEITAQESTLTVSGKSSRDEDGARFLHRGIAGRPFERRFALAEHVQVVGASLEHGLLHVDLKREVPEAAKPRRIEIGAHAPVPALTDAA